MSATGVRLNAENAVAEEIEGERKIVTALFADLKGSTELLETLDPEEGRAIVEPLLRIMSDAVRRYEGYLVQTLGDGIFALFGAPIAYEDHPQRALYAALQMQQELRAHVQAEAAKGRPALDARVGVHTGEVVAYTGEASGKVEYRLIGHTANLASRMESIASPGSIAISVATAKLCEGYFELRGLGSTSVKGISTPVEVYEVIGPGVLRSHFELSARRGLTLFIGRERELEQMRHAFSRAREGHGQLVAVVADAGTGKSRLFHEFKASIPPECKVLQAYSVSHGKASAWLPLLELLRDYFGLVDADGQSTRRGKIEDKLDKLEPALNETLPYLFGLLGVVDGPDQLAQMDPRIRRQRTLDAIKQIVSRESLNQPVLLVFEDLHWVDEQTQAFLDLLADSIATARVQLLVNYRPEYRHSWSNKSYYSQLALTVLDPGGATSMLTALLGEAVELNPLKRLIAERSGGNPFFIEEIVQELFEDGALVRNGTVKMTRSLSQLRLPPTVQGMLASRVDRLAGPQKDLLQTLAVIGREAPLALITAVAGLGEMPLVETLRLLCASEFVYQQRAFTEVEYVFKHALTQEVVYNSLLIERRKQIHETVGETIEVLFAAQLDDHIDSLAHHFSHSNNTNKAIEYLHRAGQQAIERSTHVEAIRNITTALDLLMTLPADDERVRRELQLEMTLGQALIPATGWSSSQVEDTFRRAREICGQLGNAPELFPALIGLWAVYMLRAEYGIAWSLAEELLSRATQLDNASVEMEAHLRLGAMSWYMGQPRQARDHLERALQLHDSERDHTNALLYNQDPEVAARSYLGLVLWQLGYATQAVEMSNKGVEAARRLASPFSLTFGLCYCAWLHLEVGAWAQFSNLVDEMEMLAKSHGFVQWEALSAMFQSIAHAARGQLPRALDTATEGITAYRATGARAGLPMLLALRARLLSFLGRGDDARALLGEARNLAQVSGEFNGEAELFRLEAELLLARESTGSTGSWRSSELLAEAETLTIRAVDCARSSGSKIYELRAAIDWATLSPRRGSTARACATLAQIYDSFTEGFETHDLQRAKALLAELR